MSPHWSILLPTHSSPDTIEYAIQSALMQTQENFELLIVGDGCCSRTRSKIESVSDERIRFFDLPKAAGFGYGNRNIALKEAQGEFVAFLSDDDLWLPDHLEILEREFESQDISLVMSQAIWVAPEGLVIPMVFNLNDSRVRSRFMNFEFNFLPAGCVVHRRSCFDTVGYWNAKLTGRGDWDLWVRILKRGEESNFSCVPIASNLHFRANWKTLQNEGPSEMKYWRALFDSNEDVPGILKLDLKESAIEQKEFFNLIQEKPTTYPDKLRIGIAQLIEISHRIERESNVALRKKLNSICKEREGIDLKISDAEERVDCLSIDLKEQIDKNQKLKIGLDTLQSELDSANEFIAVLSSQKKDLESLLIEVEKSLSWKLSQKLQGIVRLFFPRGKRRELWERFKKKLV